MKKLFTAILILLSISVFAQDKDLSRADMDKEEMATLQAKRLAMQLDLNEDQKNKLKDLYSSYHENLNELKRKELGENNKDTGQRKEVQENFKSELREILTTEQYLKWEQLQEKRRKGRASLKERQN